jgi:hypothetical protein
MTGKIFSLRSVWILFVSLTASQLFLNLYWELGLVGMIKEFKFAH